MRRQEGSSSFLKKRTKKLLSVLVCALPQHLHQLGNVLLALAILLPAHALADAAANANGAVHATNGADVYQHVCQGCHMRGGTGARGAGAFPALAHNEKLSVRGYPVLMVLNGNGGMPWFNGTLNDAQIANVVNYIRTHFGNAYTDVVTPADVAAVKGPVPVMER
jgi:mono/diheme cytochrome c family protein